MKIKETFKKIANVLRKVFGYGIMISLFVGGLTLFGYIAALIIGGDVATAICLFIHKSLFPWLIRLSTIMVLLGIVIMYLSGEVALTSKKESK